MVGAAAVAFTAKTNESLADFVPSLTVTVIVAVPDCEDAGVTVTVRFVPLPPNMILAVGAKAGLDEVAARVRFAAGVSLSLIEKLIGPVELLAAIV